MKYAQGTEVSVSRSQLEYRQAFGRETIKYDLASALVEARERAKLSQEELAQLFGVSQAYIAKLESGNANPTIGHVGALLATIRLRAQFRLELLKLTPGNE